MSLSRITKRTLLFSKTVSISTPFGISIRLRLLQLENRKRPISYPCHAVRDFDTAQTAATLKRPISYPCHAVRNHNIFGLIINIFLQYAIFYFKPHTLTALPKTYKKS